MAQRYARQVSLAAVGERGQQRLARATYVVASEPAAEAVVEQRYLLRAGAVHLVSQNADALPFAHAGAFRHPRARALAAGAWRALTQLRNALSKTD